jgi:hypothetical protein
LREINKSVVNADGLMSAACAGAAAGSTGTRTDGDRSIQNGGFDGKKHEGKAPEEGKDHGAGG